jgi:hypothetical protein
MRRSVVSCLYSILIAAMGCSGSTLDPSPICTQELRPAVMVQVKDSLTNVGTASGASLVVRDAAFTDSVAVPNARPDLNDWVLAAAGERAGVYQVTVSKPGYAKWVQSNVRVTKNQCHVNTVNLTALLQPTG